MRIKNPAGRSSCQEARRRRGESADHSTASARPADGLDLSSFLGQTWLLTVSPLATLVTRGPKVRSQDVCQGSCVSEWVALKTKAVKKKQKKRKKKKRGHRHTRVSRGTAVLGWTIKCMLNPALSQVFLCMHSCTSACVSVCVRQFL